METETGRWSRRRAKATGQCPQRRRSTTAAVAVVAVALALTACASPKTSPHIKTRARAAAARKAQAAAEAKTQATNPETTSGLGKLNLALPSSTDGTQTNILNQWVGGQQQLYTYIDLAPGPARANLVAGETTATLFPKLPDYYVNPALQSENLFLVRLKMQMLDGPNSYNLGNPMVTALSATTAKVAFCFTDSGTTTQSGQPAPQTLDGYDPVAPWGKGTANMALKSGTWMVASYQYVSAKTC